MSGKVKKHGRRSVKEYFIKTISYLFIMLATTVAVIFAAIQPVTDLVHKIEGYVAMEVRDIALNDSTYAPQGNVKSDAVAYDYGEKIGVITADAFGLNSSIYCGANRVSMAKGVGFDNQSGLLDGNGTSVIVGYLAGEFSPLAYAEAGDIIHITTSHWNYSYRIAEVQYVDSADDSMKDSGHSLALCGICSDFSQHNGEKLVVFADRTEGEVQ